jgi:hypothetical protein
MTDEFRPLDRYVFGVMKSSCRRLCRQFCQENPEAVMNQQTATAFLIRAWEASSPQVPDESWCIYDEAIEDER